jgi:hypothetical protein
MVYRVAEVRRALQVLLLPARLQFYPSLRLWISLFLLKELVRYGKIGHEDHHDAELHHEFH